MSSHGVAFGGSVGELGKCCDFCARHGMVEEATPEDGIDEEDLEDPLYFGELDLVSMGDDLRNEVLDEAADRWAELDARRAARFYAFPGLSPEFLNTMAAIKQREERRRDGREDARDDIDAGSQ